MHRTRNWHHDVDLRARQAGDPAVHQDKHLGGVPWRSPTGAPGKFGGDAVHGLHSGLGQGLRGVDATRFGGADGPNQK